MSLREKLENCELFRGAILLEGFDDAIIGGGTQFNHPVIIYSWKKCIEIVQSQGLSYEEAVEHLDFNVRGAYIGDSTPVFLIDNLEDVDEEIV